MSNFPGKGCTCKRPSACRSPRFPAECPGGFLRLYRHQRNRLCRRDERKNDECLANQDPMKKAQHFSLCPPKVGRLRVDIFEQNAVNQPTPDEQENVCSDKSEQTE